MRLTEAQSRELLRTHGVYVTEAGDKCGKILGHVRFTRYGEKGEWCSRLCRDGVEHKAHTCYGCGVSLNGKRKHARFCSDTCRKRLQVRNQRRNPETPIADKGLTDAICHLAMGIAGTKNVCTIARGPVRIYASENTTRSYLINTFKLFGSRKLCKLA